MKKSDSLNIIRFLETFSPLVMPAILGCVLIAAVGTTIAGWAPGINRGIHERAAASDLAESESVRWSATYRHFRSGMSIPNQVLFSPDEEIVIVSGTCSGPSGQAEVVTVGYEALAGKPLWTARHKASREGGSLFSRMAICPNGDRLYLTGWHHTRKGSFAFVVAFDLRNGRGLWSSNFDATAGWSQGRDLAISPDGERLYAVKQIESRERRGDLLVAYETQTGAEIWRANKVVADRSFGATLNKAAVSGDGSRVYAGGMQWERDEAVAWTVAAYDSTSGGILWSRIEPLPNSATISAIAACPATQRVMLAGRIEPRNAAEEWWTLLCDGRSGDVLQRGLSRDVPALLLLGDDAAVRRWLPAESPFLPRKVRSAALSRDGGALVTTGITSLASEEMLAYRTTVFRLDPARAEFAAGGPAISN